MIKMATQRPGVTGPLFKRAATGASRVTSADRSEFKSRFRDGEFGVGNACSLGRDDKGLYVYTHRARSSSYPSVAALPKSKVEFIAKTATSTVQDYAARSHMSTTRQLRARMPAMRPTIDTTRFRPSPPPRPTVPRPAVASASSGLGRAIKGAMGAK